MNSVELEAFGLAKNEAKIYVALLSGGPANIARLAARAGIHRPIVYKTLPGLKRKGLVSEAPKGKRTIYHAESPQRLKTLVESIGRKYVRLLPELENLSEARGPHPLIRYWEGRRGIRLAIRDVVVALKRGEVYYRYSSRKSAKEHEKYIARDYRRIRDEKELQRFVITSAELSKTKKPRLERAVKIVPSRYGLFDYNIAQFIYADRVLFIDYNTDTAMLIESKMIAEFQKNIFRILYDRL